MNATSCGWVQIVSAPITSFYVNVTKDNNTTTNFPYTTTAAAGDTLKFKAFVTCANGVSEPSYSWKIDDKEITGGSEELTWYVEDTHIGRSHTITCTVTTSDGFSLTKTLSVTINQKPVKMELTPRSDTPKTNTYYYDSIDAALDAINQEAHSSAAITLYANQTLSTVGTWNIPVEFHLNSHTLTMQQNVPLSGSTLTIDGDGNGNSTVAGNVNSANLTLKGPLTITGSVSCTGTDSSLMITGTPVTMQRGISYDNDELHELIRDNNLIFKKNGNYISTNGVSSCEESVTIESHRTHTYDATTGVCPCGAQESINYLDNTGEKTLTSYYVTVTPSSTNVTWSNSWYVVKDDVTINGKVTIPLGNNVHLILCDGAALTVTGGIGLPSGETDNPAKLSIYAQSTDSATRGSLTVSGEIVEGSAVRCVYLTDLTVYGGSVTVTGSNSGNKETCHGISVTNSMTVYGGSVTATSGPVTHISDSTTGRFGKSYAIYANGDGLTVRGGTVTATHGEAILPKDIYCSAFTLSGGTVQSDRETNEVKLYNSSSTKKAKITGGEIKLGASTFSAGLELDNGKSAADVLAAGYCFAKVSSNNTTTTTLIKLTDAPSDANVVVLHDSHGPENFTNSTCDYCSFKCTQHTYKKSAGEGETNFTPTGKCTICGYACTHEGTDFSQASATCATCGMGCPHTSINENGYCTTCEGYAAVVTVTYNGQTWYYATFNAAVEKATALNDTVTLTLQRDCSTDGATISTQMTLDLEGCTLTIAGSGALTVEGSNSNAANLTVQADSPQQGGDTQTHRGQINGTVKLKGAYAYLTVHGGQITALEVDQSGSAYAKLFGGTYEEITIAADCNRTLSALLGGSGYGYKSSSEWVTPADDQKTLSNVSVQPLPITGLTVTANKNTVAVGYTESDAPKLNAAAITSASGIVTYQWYQVDGSTGSEISGATSVDFTLSPGMEKGTYQYYCTATLDGYTRTSDPVTITVTNPLIPESDYTAPGAEDGLKYTVTGETPQPQQLITPGTVPAGTTMKYRLSTSETWEINANAITATDAGDYTVYWMIDGGNSYADVPESEDHKLTVTIAKADLTSRATNVSYDQMNEGDYKPPMVNPNCYYNGSARSIIYNTALKATGATFWHKINDGGWTQGTAIKATNAGTYTVYWYLDGGKNYNSINSQLDPGIVSCTIDKNRISPENVNYVTIGSITKTYDGSPDASTAAAGVITVKDRDTADLAKSNYTVSAAFADANVGVGKDVTVTINLTPEAYANYAFRVNGSLTDTYTKQMYGDITKAAAPTSDSGTLTVYNQLAHTYTFDFSALLPALDTGKTYGQTTYSIKSNNLSTDFFETVVTVNPSTGAAALTTKNVNSTETGSLGSLVVTVSSQNYNDFDLTLNITAANRLTPTGAPTLSKTTITYGDPLSTINLSGSMTADGKTVAGTFAWADPNAILAAGEGKTASWTFTPSDNVAYTTVTGTASITVTKKEVTVTGLTAVDRPYNGTTTVSLNTGSYTLQGRVGQDSLTLIFPTLNYSTVQDANVGQNKPVTVQGVTLGGDDKDNYTLTLPTNVTVNITKAAAPTVAQNGVLTVYNGRAQTYTFDFSALRPALTAMDYGTTTYAINAENTDPLNITYFPDGSVSLDSATGVATLNAASVASSVEDGLGTLVVTVTSQNFQPFNLTLKATAANQTALTGAPGHTPIRTSGKTLSDAALTPNDAWPEGTLTWVDADGSPLPDTTRVDANKSYKWVFTPTDPKYASLSGSVTLYSYSPYIPSTKPTTPEITFTDVPDGAYFAGAVRWAVENGITTGVGNGKFDPNASCTRAQIVTFLWRAAGQPQPKTAKNPFTDITDRDYFYTAVLWAVENGITTGTSATTFSPSAACTRAQAVSFLYRIEQARGGGFTGAWMFRLPFADVPEWCFEAVAWCYMQKITGGTSTLTFSPDDACTRGQIVTFLYRAR